MIAVAQKNLLEILATIVHVRKEAIDQIEETEAKDQSVAKEVKDQNVAVAEVKVQEESVLHQAQIKAEALIEVAVKDHTKIRTYD